MVEDIVLKIKEKESLEVIKYISIGYLIFLFFLALFLEYKETILQAMFILVFASIIDAFNCGELIVNEKGIKTKSIGFIRYNQIYRMNLKNRVLTVYIRDNMKPIKINFAMNEDYKLIEKMYKYVDSKIKRIEDDEREHREYVKKYLQ